MEPSDQAGYLVTKLSSREERLYMQTFLIYKIHTVMIDLYFNFIRKTL